MKDFTSVEDGSTKKYICNKCGKLLNSDSGIRNHIRIKHLDIAIYKCPLCDEKFKHGSMKDKHLDIKHGMEEIKIGNKKTVRKVKKCVCEKCKKVFSSRTVLKKHMITHKLYKCSDCSLQFTRFELGHHKFEAHGYALPTCGVCGYKNTRTSIVEAHQRKVHLKERNVPCPQCDMKFFSIGNMKKHLIRHNPVKNIECPYCQKKFPRLDALREHKKIHTGDKRKICPICDERFVQKASLNYHMGKYHPEAC